MAEAALRMNDTMIPRPDLSVELRGRMRRDWGAGEGLRGRRS